MRHVRRRVPSSSVLALSLLAAGCGAGPHHAAPTPAPSASSTSTVVNSLVPAPVEEAAAAARSLLPLVTSWDYRHLDADEATAVAASSPAFAGQLRTIFARTIRPQALASRSSTSVAVQAIGVSAVAGGSVQVVGLITQSITDNGGAPQRRPSAVQLTVTPSGGHWRVTGVSAVSTTADAPEADLTWLPSGPAAAATAARDCVRAVLTLRAAHRAADEAAALACTDGAAKSHLQASYAALPTAGFVDRVGFQPLVGVSNATADTVRLVAADGVEPSGAYRLLITMVRSGAEWRLTELQDAG